MFSDLTFLHSHHYPHCTALVDKHFAGYASLQWMEAGAVELFYGHARHELHADSNTTWFWTAFPGPRIRFHSANGSAWNHRYAAFAGPRVESWKRAGLWPTEPQSAPNPSIQRARFDELLALIAAGGDWNTRRALHALEGILLALAQSRATPDSSQQWLQTARDFLSNNSDFAPDYNLLARDLGMGLSTLRRRFKTATVTRSTTHFCKIGSIKRAACWVKPTRPSNKSPPI